MQIPPTSSGCELDLEQPVIRMRMVAFIGTFVVIGIAVWVLAIAKLVDLYQAL